MSANIAYGLALTAVELVGDASLKHAATAAPGPESELPLYIGIGVYNVLALMLLHFFRRGGSLALTNGAWDAWSNVATTLYAVLFAGERLTPTNYLGLALTIAGLALL